MHELGYYQEVRYEDGQVHIIVTAYNEVIVTLYVSLYEMTNHFHLCLGTCNFLFGKSMCFRINYF